MSRQQVIVEFEDSEGKIVEFRREKGDRQFERVAAVRLVEEMMMRM